MGDGGPAGGPMWGLLLAALAGLAVAGQAPGQQPSLGVVFAGAANESLRLSHMVLDRVTGRLVVGGVNRLFQLDANLRPLATVVTGPKPDSPACHASGCESPDVATTLTDNINKILVLDPESRYLIVCGSLSQGSCEKYSASNITHPPEFFARAVAANDETASTYAFIGPERYNNWGTSNVLYVGTTFTNNGEYRHDVPAISSRRLHNLDFAELSFSKQSSLQIEVKYRDHFLVKYVYGFNASDYAYFVVVQKQSHLPEQEELGYVTRLARTCITDANYDSYTEVTLQCHAHYVGEDGKPATVNYNLIQDAKVVAAGQHLAASMGLDAGDPVMIGTFSPARSITAEPQARSALCVYSLKDIEAKFNENIHMCFNGSLGYRNMNYISGLILDGMCPTAGTTGNIMNFCEVGLKISGVAPISSLAALHVDNATLSSVTVGYTERHTVAFLGSQDGVVRKVLVAGSNQALEYESVSVDPGHAVLPDSSLSSNGDFLYVLSTSKVSRMRVEHCGSFTNCSSCLEAKDPYCGWCSLEKRCTVRGACQKAAHSSPRWLSVGSGQQCIDFEQVLPDRIPVSQMTTVSAPTQPAPTAAARRRAPAPPPQYQSRASLMSRFLNSSILASFRGDAPTPAPAKWWLPPAPRQTPARVHLPAPSAPALSAPPRPAALPALSGDLLRDVPDGDVTRRVVIATTSESPLATLSTAPPPAPTTTTTTTTTPPPPRPSTEFVPPAWFRMTERSMLAGTSRGPRISYPRRLAVTTTTTTTSTTTTPRPRARTSRAHACAASPAQSVLVAVLVVWNKLL